jgi:hypothetical protein
VLRAPPPLWQPLHLHMTLLLLLSFLLLLHLAVISLDRPACSAICTIVSHARGQKLSAKGRESGLPTSTTLG